jgi:hypothetical protein
MRMQLRFVYTFLQLATVHSAIKLCISAMHFRISTIPSHVLTIQHCFTIIELHILKIPLSSRDSSVGIATRYGLDGLGIESRWGERFSALVQTGPGAHPASYTMGTGSLLGVKWPGRGTDHPSLYTAKVKERVELYSIKWSLPVKHTFYLYLIYYSGNIYRLAIEIIRPLPKNTDP